MIRIKDDRVRYCDLCKLDKKFTIASWVHVGTYFCEQCKDQEALIIADYYTDDRSTFQKECLNVTESEIQEQPQEL